MLPRGSVNVFGHIAPNGLNFRRSIHNPNSRLAKVVAYINKAKDAGYLPTRREISRNALGAKDNVSSGWGTYVFGLARKTGFITATRVGNTYVYNTCDLSNAVKRS